VRVVHLLLVLLGGEEQVQRYLSVLGLYDLQAWVGGKVWAGKGREHSFGWMGQVSCIPPAPATRAKGCQAPTAPAQQPDRRT
jgi:hypothetical protein